MMDQIKIGKFIQQMRKEKNLTQREVADSLGISDKTVSKWETGNGLPEVSLMMPLCELLGISVNEMLSGERLDGQKYHEKAEDNILKLMDKRQEMKKNIFIMVMTMTITLLGAFTLIITSGLLEMHTWQRWLLIGIGFVILIGGITVVAIIDRTAGVHECRKCGEKFVPEPFDYVMGMHTIRYRYLECPKCGAKSWCRRRLS